MILHINYLNSAGYAIAIDSKSVEFAPKVLLHNDKYWIQGEWYECGNECWAKYSETNFLNLDL